MRTLALTMVALGFLGCGGDAEDTEEDFGIGKEDVLPTDADGVESKEDAVLGRRGPLVNTNTTRTQVWTARNKWEDRDTPAARAAGLAWPANSGLNWDEKYARWIKSLTKTRGDWFDTYEIVTPWGKRLSSPSLECAETSIVLRITFAAWYELPFFLEARDRTGNRLFFGHFGIRTLTSRYAGMPEFAIAYKDYSARTDLATNWASDATLKAKKIQDQYDDAQPALGGAHFGAYMDELHANKRVGYFTMIAVNYFGSMNLADSANTFNLVPEALREGDTLLERWQRSGIGHTLVVKDVSAGARGTIAAELISGSMPRRQGKWESAAASKEYFTTQETGGSEIGSDGVPYAKLGGGIKRWRVTKNVGGYWTNTFMQGDESKWINDTDTTRIGERPTRFETLLGEVPPEQLRDAMLAVIADARSHLSRYPASCSARGRREDAFARLYEVNAASFGMSRAETDRRFRTLEDYVFAALDYETSKTCCWNSTTADMYAVVMSVAHKEQQGQCKTPTVFRATGGGYDLWAREAQALGKTWRPWTEDETCAQRGVSDDTVEQTTALAWCAR